MEGKLTSDTATTRILWGQIQEKRLYNERSAKQLCKVKICKIETVQMIMN
jgi:hypothetical protein